MKEYEDLSAEYGLGSNARYPYTGDDILNAYQAGFLKAREMSRDLIDHHDIIGDKLCMVQCLSKLGEKEV